MDARRGRNQYDPAGLFSKAASAAFLRHDAATALTKLKKVMKTAPPAPEKVGGRVAVKRPVYPDWQEIGEPGD